MIMVIMWLAVSKRDFEQHLNAAALSPFSACLSYRDRDRQATELTLSNMAEGMR